MSKVELITYIAMDLFMDKIIGTLDTVIKNSSK